MISSLFFSYHNLLKRGVRIALRAKVNDSIITGIRVIDSILPVGRGQRQLILGDRYTGKTSIYVFLLLNINSISSLVIDGLGTKRLFGLYIGINQNLSKLFKLLNVLHNILWSCLFLSTHSATTALLSFMIPLIGISISERLRDRSYDTVICFDDCSKHAKSYRQISLIMSKIPSRDAYPADIFNIHSSLLERCGKLKSIFFGGSITAFPCIETINSDITEYIATNLISITDGQFYTNRSLFLNTVRPAIDSGLSVSRIGSNAQCKLIKVLASGIKNETTTFRINEFSNLNSLSRLKLLHLNLIFKQDYLLSSSLEQSVIMLLLYRNMIYFNSSYMIHKLMYSIIFDYFYFYYMIFLIKHDYNNNSFVYINQWLLLITNN